MRVPRPASLPVLRWQLERDGIRAADDAQLEQIVLSQRERAKTLRGDGRRTACFSSARPRPYDEKAVRKHVTTDVLAAAGEAADGARPTRRIGPHRAIHDVISALAAAKGISLGKLAQPIRLAVCGGTVSPPIDATLAILGKLSPCRD